MTRTRASEIITYSGPTVLSRDSYKQLPCNTYSVLEVREILHYLASHQHLAEIFWGRWQRICNYSCREMEVGESIDCETAWGELSKVPIFEENLCCGRTNQWIKSPSWLGVFCIRWYREGTSNKKNRVTIAIPRLSPHLMSFNSTDYVYLTKVLPFH